MMYGYGTGVGFGPEGLLGLIGMVLLVIGIIVLVAWLVGRARLSTPTQHTACVPQPAGFDAIELLRMRFARGEITEDEYRSAKQVLEDGR